VFYEKFWVTGNTITVLKWNISFAEQEEITNSQVISCLWQKQNWGILTGERLFFEHNLISSGAYGRDKEMSVNKFMRYGYFVVQELDNVYTKTVGQPWDLTRMGTATDELKLDIAIKPLVLML
jgi:hypothetical protein